MNHIGVVSIHIAAAIFNFRYDDLKSILAHAWEYHEVDDVARAIGNALVCLEEEHKAWFYRAVVAIQAGNEEGVGSRE